MTDSAPSNIDRFNQYAGFFLARLYESFPVPVDLDCHEAVYHRPLLGTPGEGSISDKELQRASCDAEVAFAAHTLKWLSETGYFKAEYFRLHDVQAIRVVLTPKGFEALNAAPASLTRSGPLGQQLSDLSKSAANEAGKAAIGEIVGQIIGVALKGLFTP